MYAARFPNFAPLREATNVILPIAGARLAADVINDFATTVTGGVSNRQNRQTADANRARLAQNSI